MSGYSRAKRGGLTRAHSIPVVRYLNSHPSGLWSGLNRTDLSVFANDAANTRVAEAGADAYNPTASAVFELLGSLGTEGVFECRFGSNPLCPSGLSATMVLAAVTAEVVGRVGPAMVKDVTEL